MEKKEIREPLLRCIKNSYNRIDIQIVLEECYSIAHSYLKMKCKKQKSFLLKNESLDDLAWDFIADLFHKDKEGNLEVLKCYFESKKINTLNDSDLRVELRKLVFSKVDDNVFRFYGERDPSLRKIIRNIKLAIRDQKCKKSVCYMDGYVIVDQDKDDTQLIMPEDFMRIKLCSRLNEQMQIPEIMITVIDIIQQQNSYQNRFPLVALAKIIRETFVNLNEVNFSETSKTEAESRLNNRDVEHFLDKSLEKVRNNVSPGYVRRGKMGPEYVDIYFNTATNILLDEFKNGENLSQYDQLKNYISELDHNEFRTNHRSVLEYVVKLIRKDFINTLKKEWR